MDDTALNPQLQNQQPTTQPSSAQNAGGQVNIGQPPVIQQPNRPVEPPQAGSRHPEQAPVSSGLPPREAAPVTEAEAVTAASDDQAAAPDAVSDAADVQHEAAPDNLIQEAHPAVEVSPQLQEIGVEKGPDAEKSDLPEEQLAKPEEEAKQPDTQTAASGISLSTPPLQIKEVEKKNGIRTAIRWLAVSLIRQLKKMQMKPEEQKSTW